MDKNKIMIFVFHTLLAAIIVFYSFKLEVIAPFSDVMNKFDLLVSLKNHLLYEFDIQTENSNKKDETEKIKLAYSQSFTPSREGIYYSNPVYNTMISEVSKDTLLDTASEFYNIWLNISSDSLQMGNAKEQYKQRFITYFHPESYIADDSGVIYTVEEYIDKFIEIICQTNTTIKSRFITEEGLLFNRLTDVCRGILYYEIVTCNDIDTLGAFTEFGRVEAGKTYFSVVEADFSIQTKGEEDNFYEYNWLTFVRERRVTQPKEVVYDLDK